jgi:N-acetyllactosaminide beta-1,3-N-acetylglucosaminyltransferase
MAAGLWQSRALACLFAIMTIQWVVMYWTTSRDHAGEQSAADAHTDEVDHSPGSAEVLALLAQRLLSSEASFQTLLLSLEMDAAYDHRILRDAIPADDTRQTKIDKTLTFCTQASTSALPGLLSLAEAHQGPVSAAVFIAERSPDVALATVALLRRCSAAVRRYVSFHFVFLAQDHTLEGLPDNAFSLFQHDRLWPATLPCDVIYKTEHLPAASEGSHAAQLGFGERGRGENGEERGERRGSAINYALNAPYPNNLLRNVARSGSRTEWIAVVDVDLVPARGTSAAVERAAREAKRRGTDLSRVAFVLPAFEMATDQSPPAKRDELLKMLQEKTAQPFYKDACWKCQRYEGSQRNRRAILHVCKEGSSETLRFSAFH